MPGVTKSTSSSSSAGPVADALTALSGAAAGVINAVRQEAQAEIAQARAERDDALRVAEEARLEAKDWEMREAGWRAALEKADMTIKHEAQTNAQLRNEVEQWKTQLTRLEDSSRQEIEDWKEQYRRAEQERARLSARIDELVSGQMAWNAAAHAYATPYTPRIAYTDIPEPSTSSGAKRASTVSRPRKTGGTPHRAGRAQLDTDESPPTTSRKPRLVPGAHSDHELPPTPRNGSPAYQSARRRKEQVSVEIPRASGSKATRRPPSPARRESQAYSEPRQQVIRRVTAIVNVKEEESEDALDDHASARSGSVYDPDEDIAPIPPSGRRRRASQSATRRRPLVQDWDEDEQTPDVGDDADQYEDEPEDEDDELLLGPKKTKPPAGSAKQFRANGAGKAQGVGKTLKRKIDADLNALSGRSATAKAAKTR